MKVQEKEWRNKIKVECGQELRVKTGGGWKDDRTLDDGEVLSRHVCYFWFIPGSKCSRGLPGIKFEEVIAVKLETMPSYP